MILRAIVIAMKEESQSLGEFNKGINVLDSKNILIITGIGKVNAAIEMTKAIMNYQISEVINIGFAGSIKKHHVYDAVLVNRAIQHDVDLTAFGYEKYQLPEMPIEYRSNEKLLKKMSNLFSFKHDLLYSGDQFITSINHEDGLYDMEGAALYQVCYISKVPIISIKIVSDIIGDSSNDFGSFNVIKGSKIISDILKKIIGG